MSKYTNKPKGMIQELTFLRAPIYYSNDMQYQLFKN